MGRLDAAVDGTLGVVRSTPGGSVSTSPRPGPPFEWVSDKVDLDELFRDAKPIGDVADWAIPGFFADEEEFRQFQAWLKAERAAGLV
jgi:hypothetical protein